MDIILQCVRINNFRSIENMEVDLGAINILIGQNNAGKSNFLGALDVAFNGSRTISEEDIYIGYNEHMSRNKKAIIDLKICPFNGKDIEKAFSDFWKFDVLDRIFRDLLGADRQVFVKGLDGRKLTRTGGRIDAGGVWGFRIFAVVRQIGQEIEDLGRFDRGHEGCINIRNRNIFERCVVRHLAAHKLQKAQEHAQVEVVFGDSAARLPLDCLVIR